MQRSASRTSESAVSDNDSRLHVLPRPYIKALNKHHKGTSLTLEPVHLRNLHESLRKGGALPGSIRSAWPGYGKRASLRTLSNFGSQNPSPRLAKTPRNLRIHPGHATNELEPDTKSMFSWLACGTPRIRQQYAWSCCGKEIHETGCVTLENVECFCGHMLQTKPTSPRNLYWQNQAKRKRFQKLLLPPEHRCTYCWEPMENMFEIVCCERGNCDFEMHSECVRKYKNLSDRILQNMAGLGWGRPVVGEPSYFTQVGEPSLASLNLPTPKKPVRKGSGADRAE